MLTKQLKEIAKVLTGSTEVERIEIKNVNEDEAEVTLDYKTSSIIGSLLGAEKSEESQTFIIKKKS